MIFYSPTTPSPSSGRRGTKYTAFTLVELLVSLTIISIMAVMSISAYPKFSEQISLSAETYKMLAYFRETQTYGVSAVATPGTKFVYAFKVSKNNSNTGDNGKVERYQIESPTLKTNTYYLDTSVLDSSAKVNTLKTQFEISNIDGINKNGTTSLDTGFAFFRRPNPEARLAGKIGTTDQPPADALDTTGFDRIEVSIRSKRTPEFVKKVVILSTGQMYVNDW